MSIYSESKNINNVILYTLKNTYFVLKIHQNVNKFIYIYKSIFFNLVNFYIRKDTDSLTQVLNKNLQTFCISKSERFLNINLSAINLV